MLLWTLAVAGMALTCRPAPAQIVYEFASNASPFTVVTSFSIQQGSSQTFRVYLHETPASAPNLNGGGGLQASGARAVVSDPTKATVGSPTPATTGNANAQWTNSNTGNPAADGSATAANSSVFNVLTFGTAVSTDAAGRILLGTFTFTGLTPTAAGTPVNVTLQDPNSANTANTTNVSGASLDSVIGNGTLALTVTGVPEPGTMLLCGMGAIGLAAFRRRFRKAPVTETEAVQA